MKKKMVTLSLAAVMVLGLGNVVFAHSGPSDNGWSFEEMIPFMKEMHPEMEQQEMEQMYQDCHGSNNNGSPVMNNQL
ncbi:hypothetical protein ACFQ3N_17815 [Virgibacillus byunsanensis]|uniref:FAD/FMN-containing dehydrogenase n=1 Tax=Virgibacillus byunsanensis TaxID=570945 RepID=A0ABW3LQ68_9BACI